MSQATDSRGGSLGVAGLNVFYRSGREAFHAVQDFTLHAAPGQFICLLGPTGCGKSTILNVIAGFTHADAGSVALDGQPITGPGPDRGVVFQQYVLFPWKTVLGNVEFGLKLQGKAKSERRQIARRFVELVGLREFERKYPQELSGGMQQRVGIARILASGPKVMLMDEPFGALDAQTRVMMQELLLQIWEQQRKTVVFVTHDVDEALFLSDVIYLMTARPGRVKDVFENKLPRPRTIEIMTSEAYMSTKRRILALIREESLAALAQQMSTPP